MVVPGIRNLSNREYYEFRNTVKTGYFVKLLQPSKKAAALLLQSDAKKNRGDFQAPEAVAKAGTQLSIFA